MPIEEIADAVRTLQSAGAELRARLDAMKTGQMDWTPNSDFWSPREIVGHLADVELAYGFRLRKILAEDAPAYPAFDEEAWTARENHAGKDAETLFAAWRTLRRWHLALIEGLTPDDLKRTGRHEQAGEQTLAQVLRLLAEHDRYHLRRLDELAARWEETHR
jgi:uncharacterized damage-inducible protein DinB